MPSANKRNMENTANYQAYYVAYSLYCVTFLYPIYCVTYCVTLAQPMTPVTLGTAFLLRLLL